MNNQQQGRNFAPYMNKIYEFAAEAAFTDYIDMCLDDSTRAKKLRETEHIFKVFYNSLDLSEDIKSALDEQVCSLISRYENYAYVSGFCKWELLRSLRIN